MFPTPNVGRSPVDRGYLLPEEPEGHALRCVSFLIPDTIEYRAALYRQVYDLGVTETWDREDPQKAMLAAEVWTGALQSSFRLFEDGCVMPITAIRIDGCNLEVQIDESDDWVVIGDMTACVIAASPPPTIVRQDITPPGNMQQDIGGAGYTDIANTDFLWRSGLYEMYGQLQIDSVASPGAGVKLQKSNVDYGVLDIALTYLRLKAVQKLVFEGATSGWMIMQETGRTSVRTGNYTGYGQSSRFEVVAATGDQVAIDLVTPNTGIPLLRGARPDGNFASISGNAEFTAMDDIMIYRRLTGGAQGEAGILIAGLDDATPATKKANLKLQVNDWTGRRTLVHGRADGTAAMIGFLGITPSPRLAITGDHHKNAITKQIVEALALFGLVTDATTNTAVEVVVGETQGYAVMQDLLAHLENYTNGGIVDSTSEGECLLVCEVPPPEFYCKVYDFTDEDDRAPWVIERGQVGTGFESTMSDEMVFIHTAQFDVFRVIGVTIEYNQSGISDGTILFGAYDFAGYTSTDFGLVDPGTGMQVIADYDPTYDAFTGFRIVATSTDPAQQIQITGLKVYGYDQGLYGIIEGGTDCP